MLLLMMNENFCGDCPTLKGGIQIKRSSNNWQKKIIHISLHSNSGTSATTARGKVEEEEEEEGAKKNDHWNWQWSLLSSSQLGNVILNKQWATVMLLLIIWDDSGNAKRKVEINRETGVDYFPREIKKKKLPTSIPTKKNTEKHWKAMIYTWTWYCCCVFLLSWLLLLLMLWVAIIHPEKEREKNLIWNSYFTVRMNENHPPTKLSTNPQQ